MARTKINVGVTISEEVMKAVEDLMDKESRSKSNAMEYLIKRGLESAGNDSKDLGPVGCGPAFVQERDVDSPRTYTVKVVARGRYTEQEISRELLGFVRANFKWIIDYI